MDTIFKILGTPPKEFWREGYDLALKRNFTFTVHKKIPLKFLFEDVSVECIHMLERMFTINPQFRPLAGELLQEPYFKTCSLKSVYQTRGPKGGEGQHKRMQSESRTEAKPED